MKHIKMLFARKQIYIIALLTLGFNACLALKTVVIPSELLSKLSVNIVDSSDGNTVFSYQADTPRLIASNVKLFTTLFGLETLGSDFEWSTQLFYTGDITNQTLKGNLYLTGGGDPTLDDKTMYNILSQLKVLGIKKINGNIIFDSHIFNTKPVYSMLDYTDFDVDTVLPNGLIINGNIVQFTIFLNRQQVKLKSNLYQYKVVNNLILNPKSAIPCAEPYKNIKLNLDESNPVIALSGQISNLCNKKTMPYNLLSTFLYNKMVLTKILNDIGVTLNGNYLDGSTPNDATLIYEHNSVNLAKALKTMNYFSNNLIAEAVLLSSAAYKTKNTDTFANAKSLFNKFLVKYQINNPKFELENGAGLSRTEYFTANNVAHLLYVANKSPLSTKFEATLPTPGQGTLRQSFPNLKGRLYAKTGTLNDVSSYSGYLYAQDGKKYIIVLVANDITQAQRKLFYNWANKLLSSM